MSPNPSILGSQIGVLWNIPKEISDRTDINYVRVWRSSSENEGYTLIAATGCTSGTGIPTTYIDSGKTTRDSYYLVTFGVGATGATGATGPELSYESNYNSTYFYPYPKELRLIEIVKRSMPDVIIRSGVGLTDADYMVGLNLAVQIFNSYPPETYYNLSNFPTTHEYFVVGLAQLTTLASRFLTISIRDWSYSEPGGVVMQIDRGAKINQALQIIGNVYTQYLPLVKLDFGSENACAAGTIPLPLSLGSTLSRGMLNCLDIFNAVGR